VRNLFMRFRQGHIEEFWRPPLEMVTRPFMASAS